MYILDTSIKIDVVYDNDILIILYGSKILVHKVKYQINKIDKVVH